MVKVLTVPALHHLPVHHRGRYRGRFSYIRLLAIVTEGFDTDFDPDPDSEWTSLPQPDYSSSVVEGYSGCGRRPLYVESGM
jgi:hypothetical protein